MVCVVADLEAYYDRQLASIESIILESIGVDWKAAILFARILPALKHYICTNFGISSNSYGDTIDKHGGIGQENLFAGEGYKVKLCLIIYDMEELEQGVIITVPILNSSIKRTAIAFVDDTSFYTNREDYKKKIQTIIERYTKLYEATGAK